MRKILISAISSRVYVAAIQDQQVVFLESVNAARTTSSFMARHTARALHVMGGVDALGRSLRYIFEPTSQAATAVAVVWL